MKLYSKYTIPAKNYFLSYEDDLSWLVQKGELDDEEKAKSLQIELNDYYSEMCNIQLSKILNIQSKIKDLRLEINILLSIPHSILYQKTEEIEHVIKKFGIDVSDNYLNEINRKIRVRNNKIKEFARKLPEGSETPKLSHYNNGLDLIESVTGTHVHEDITFERFCHKLNYATRSKNKKLS